MVRLPWRAAPRPGPRRLDLHPPASPSPGPEPAVPAEPISGRPGRQTLFLGRIAAGEPARFRDGLRQSARPLSLPGRPALRPGGPGQADRGLGPEPPVLRAVRIGHGCSRAGPLPDLSGLRTGEFPPPVSGCHRAHRPRGGAAAEPISSLPRRRLQHPGRLCRAGRNPGGGGRTGNPRRGGPSGQKHPLRGQPALALPQFVDAGLPGGIRRRRAEDGPG